MTHPLASVSEKELSKLLHLTQRILVSDSFFANDSKHQKNHIGPGTELAGYANYSFGDDFKKIDWRQTARHKTPQVKQYLGTYSAEWYICLDNSASMSAPSLKKWERGLQIAAAFAYLLLGLNNKVGIVVYDKAIQYTTKAVNNNLHYRNIYKYLSSLPIPRPGTYTDILSCLPVIGRQHPIIVISDLFDKGNITDSLSILRRNKRSVQAIQLTDYDGGQIALNTDVILEDIETGESLSFTASQSGIYNASRNMQKYNNKIKSFCSSKGIHITQISSEVAWSEILLQHLRHYFRKK